MTSNKKWYYLGTMRYMSITYDVWHLFGMYFIREHYPYRSSFSGRIINQEMIDVHPQSQLGWFIKQKFNGPETVFDLLAVAQMTHRRHEVR